MLWHHKTINSIGLPGRSSLSVAKNIFHFGTCSLPVKEIIICGMKLQHKQMWTVRGQGGGVASLVEGVKQPFIAWTEHKNLECLRSVKRPNSLPIMPKAGHYFSAALIFIFLTVQAARPARPSSPTHSLSSSKELPNIVPQICFLGVGWKSETGHWRSVHPNSLSTMTLCSFTAHLMWFSCHPAVKRTLFVIQQCPLPVPSHPWSHISLDSVTALRWQYNHPKSNKAVFEDGGLYAAAKIAFGQRDNQNIINPHFLVTQTS